MIYDDFGPELKTVGDPQNSYYNTYRMTKPKGTKYLDVLAYLRDNGPTRKIDILKELGMTSTSTSAYDQRGQMSSLFAALKAYGLTDYDPKTRCVYLTYRGEMFLKANE